MKAKPWAFAIFFLAFVAVLFFNNFELPKMLFFKKTNTTDAVIIQTKEVVGKIPFTTDFINTFIFENKDSIYISRFRTPSYQKENYIGDSLKIKYNIEDPNNNKVIGYYRNIQNKPFAFWEKEKYTNISGSKKFDLILNNLVYTHIEYQEDVGILNKTGGLYEVHNDSIILRPLIKYNVDKNYEFETILPLKNDFKKRYFIILYDNKVQEIESL